MSKLYQKNMVGYRLMLLERKGKGMADPIISWIMKGRSKPLDS